MSQEVIAYSVIAAALIVGYAFVKLPVIRRAYLPASVAAGILLLLAGPEVGKFIPPAYYQTWSPLPAMLINVVFAALFLGRPFLSLRKMWRIASPQAAFGQMIAWGYYAVGGLLTLFVLIPFFAATPLVASLIEISFEGGHGTAAGMIPVFNEFGFKDGQELSVALATTSLVCTLSLGFLLIAWGRRKGLVKEGPIESVHHRVYYRRIYHDLRKQGVRLREEFSLKRFVSHTVLLALGVGLGFIFYWVLLFIEQATWGRSGVILLGYMPVFPFCMFGGIAAQMIWSKLGFIVSRPVVEVLSAASLAVLIATAIGTMTLDFFARDGWIFTLLATTGVAWVLFCFIVLGKRMFKRHWFTNSIISIGQSMGTTATGLLFAQVVDPKQKTGAVESFGYKQLLFEPFMGGGLVTALSIPLIVGLGLPLFTIICAGVALVWMIAGLFYFSRLEPPLG